ncbi:MAG: gliding motility-associated C-terminal domain-containing protein [Chitinophagales bacterium]|nr:gliding motility-associated C-terminal domain-containing protein [Bacteroidota bacterium]MCB9043789.1 gliding motility-associated C-terminal domain-containing protein [Chitinophagales bacterium]
MKLKYMVLIDFLKRYLVALSVIVLLWNNLQAQNDCLTMSVSNSQSACVGDSVQLSGALLTGTALGFYWQPESGLNDPNSLHPKAVVGISTVNYILTFDGTSGNELITNGDFSDGSVGFTSQYAKVDTALIAQGVYRIEANGKAANPSWQDCTDHTQGDASGAMLCVNGSTEVNVQVWCQTVNVSTQTSYAFSAWLQTMVNINPAILQFSVNGEVIDQPFQASATACEWAQFYAVWESGSNTTAEICIVNQNTVSFGNDFALDDISFRELCSVSDSVRVSPETANLSLGDDFYLCDGDVEILNGGTASAYLWSDGSTGASLSISQPGTYWVEITSASGCMASDTVEVFNQNCCIVQIPTAFTPNGDGLNDLLRPAHFCNLENFNLKVFNRWGEKIFETSDGSSGWDGFVGGLSAPVGVYMWLVQYNIEEDGTNKTINLQGNTTLLR